MTPSEIELATFGLQARCLKHLRYVVPPPDIFIYVCIYIYIYTFMLTKVL